MNELIALVSGRTGQKVSSDYTAVKRSAPDPGSIPHGKERILGYDKKEIRPDQVIPFDEDDEFKDF